VAAELQRHYLPVTVTRCSILNRPLRRSIDPPTPLRLDCLDQRGWLGRFNASWSVRTDGCATTATAAFPSSRSSGQLRGGRFRHR
jgi:hypothetical protein